MCNAWNHPPGCPCGFGGEGHLGRRTPETYRDTSDASQRTRSWTLHDKGSRLTYPTSCWWCEGDVYFFRDENGGCALFDALGPPWPIHDCWEDHVRRSSISSAIERSLESAEFDGDFYPPQGIKVAKPRKGADELTLTGFVADNHALYPQPQVFRLRSHRRADSLPLVIMEVATEGHLYPFVISEVAAKEIPDYSLVEIKGKWKKKGRHWYLLTTSLRRIEPNHRRGKYRNQLALTGACTYCGCELAIETRWGFDNQGSEECCTCGEMRGRIPRGSFFEHVRIILTQNA